MRSYLASLVFVVMSTVSFFHTEVYTSPSLTATMYMTDPMALAEQETVSQELEPRVRSTVPVPPGLSIENEGEVLIDIRTVNSVVDTAWIVRSSGNLQVDDFALNYVREDYKPAKMGFGDPPLLMQLSVRIPYYSIENFIQSTNTDMEEVINVPVTVPQDSDIENEGDVLFHAQIVDTLIDSFRIVRSSGYPEVDEIAEERVQSMTWNKFRTNSESLLIRIFVRQPS